VWCVAVALAVEFPVAFAVGVIEPITNVVPPPPEFPVEGEEESVGAAVAAAPDPVPVADATVLPLFCRTTIASSSGNHLGQFKGHAAANVVRYRRIIDWN
jgi:hypothetical protein